MTQRSVAFARALPGHPNAARDNGELDPVDRVAFSGHAGEGWTEENLHRLAADLRTTQLVGEVMNILAEAPDEALTLDELAERTGHSHCEFKTLWTYASRQFAGHYGTHKTPVSKMAGDQLSPPRDNVVYYFLTAGQAAMWARVRNA